VIRAAVLSALLLAALGAARLQGQQRLTLQPEGRVDVLAARRTAVQGGIGVSLPAGRSVRLELVSAAGASTVGGYIGFSTRLEGVARYLLDPDFDSRWGAYGGGGLGARYDRGAGWRGVLIALIGLEGPRWGGVVPFVEAGYGGGSRVGAGVRRALPERR
jgi:hypothetical protein